MANFSTKIFGLVGTALTFAGMAFGQATCAAPSAQTNIIRAEGTTELVAPMTFSCTVTAPNTVSAATGTATVQVFLSPALPVTSKATSSSASEAVITVQSVAGGPILSTTQSQTVSGSTINFTGIPLPAGGTGALIFTVSNVRVNATSLSVGSGVPPSISETAFVSGSATNINPAALASTTVAFAQNGLAPAKSFKTFTLAVGQSFPNGTTSSSGANSFVICNAYSPSADKINFGSGAVGTAVTAGKSLAFVVQVNENFVSAFKTLAGEASSVAVSAGTTNAVAEGTRIQVNFTNVPANVTLYVPTAAITSVAGAAAVTLTASPAGTAFAAVTPSTASGITGTSNATGTNFLVAPVAISSGSGSAVFEVTAQDTNNLDQFNIPVFAVASANAVAGTTTPIATSVSFNPIGSTVIPNFAVGASTTTLNESTFSLCTTSLLFTFVTNQLGFDTGIAISNTSTDPFGSSGATAQAGTCTLNFYGAGAPSPANVVTPNVPTGTVYAQVLSGVAAGFQGYIIAQCNFQYAHGFAFITDGVGVNGGLSQGYLAGVIPDVNQVSRGANPIGSVTASGSGETLGN